MYVNCPRCDGFLVRDKGFEQETHVKPAYKCINCGRYIDRAILKHSSLTPTEMSSYADRAKYGPTFSRQVSTITK